MDRLRQKNTIDKKITSVKTFPLMKFSTVQGIGVELEPIVKVGDKVKVGSLLAKPKEGMLGANLHSSISGEVVKIVKEELEKDTSGTVIYVTNDDKNDMQKPLKPLEEINTINLCKRLDDCGVIGLGGGGYPLSLKIEKFSKQEEVKDKYIFINGSSSDGYYTADIAVMREYYDKILRGIEILQKVTLCERIVIVIRKGIEKYITDLINKIDCMPNVYIVKMPNKICVGDEITIANYILGLNLSNEDMLIDSGHFATNIQTICAMVDAVDYGLPCISRVITCAGEVLKEPCNALVKIGCIYEDVIEAIGGEKFPISKFKQLEEDAKNDYMSYLSLRDEFKQDETDEDVKNEMIEMRKKSNHNIMEFLKAEKLYKHILLEDMICGGYLSGIKKDNLEFSITKTTLAIVLLNKRESKIRDRHLKAFLNKRKKN